MPYLGRWSSTSQLVWCSSHSLAAVWPCLTCNYLYNTIYHPCLMGFWKAFHCHTSIKNRRWKVTIFERTTTVNPMSQAHSTWGALPGIPMWSSWHFPIFEGSDANFGGWMRKEPSKTWFVLYCQDCPVWQHVGDKWEKELRRVGHIRSRNWSVT